MGPKGRQRDIDSNYLKGAHSWNERMLKYSELCSLDFYLIKYEVFYKEKVIICWWNNIQEAFEGGADALKEFQGSMEDDIERGEKLKQELVREGWGGKSLHPILRRFQDFFREWNKTCNAKRRNAIQIGYTYFISSAIE